MLNFIAKILMDKAAEGAGGGGTPPAPPATPPAPPSPPPPQPSAKEHPALKADGDKYDELGYPKAPAEDPSKKAGEKTKEGDPPPKDPAKEKVENPVTGYGEDPPKVEDPPPPKAPEPPKAPPTDLEKKMEGLHTSFQTEIKKQVEALGLEGEKLDKFIQFKKDEQAAATAYGQNQQREQQAAIQRQRSSWHKELKEDPAFGGDKFAANVTRGEKVLDEYLPELKKELTENKQMLRPSVMRGLARLADALYPSERLVQGDPPAPPKSEDETSDDPLAFYNS